MLPSYTYIATPYSDFAQSNTVPPPPRFNHYSYSYLDLEKITDLLIGYSAGWEYAAHSFGLPEKEVNAIKIDHRHSPEECMTTMLKKVLKEIDPGLADVKRVLNEFRQYHSTPYERFLSILNSRY